MDIYSNFINNCPKLETTKCPSAGNEYTNCHTPIKKEEITDICKMNTSQMHHAKLKRPDSLPAKAMRIENKPVANKC